MRAPDSPTPPPRQASWTGPAVGAGLDDGLLDAVSLRRLTRTGRWPDSAGCSMRSPDADALVAALGDDEPLRARLSAVLGLSAALGDHLVRHPDHWRVLSGLDIADRPDAAEVRAAMLAAVGADPELAQPVASGAELDALRVAYRRHAVRQRRRSTSPTASTSPSSPANWPTWPLRRWRPHWRSPGQACTQTPRHAGWP